MTRALAVAVGVVLGLLSTCGNDPYLLEAAMPPPPRPTITCGPPPPRVEADGCKVFRMDWTPDCDLVLICDKARIVIYRIPYAQPAPKPGSRTT